MQIVNCAGNQRGYTTLRTYKINENETKAETDKNNESTKTVFGV